MSYDSYKKAAEIAGHRLDKQIEKERNSTSAMSLEDLAKKIDEGDVQEINVLIKADVQGSAEALKASMEKLEVEGNVRINVIRSTVGTITEFMDSIFVLVQLFVKKPKKKVWKSVYTTSSIRLLKNYRLL